MEMLTLQMAGSRAGVTPTALRLAIRDGRLSGFKLGRDWFVYANELERYIRERKTWNATARVKQSA